MIISKNEIFTLSRRSIVLCLMYRIQTVATFIFASKSYVSNSELYGNYSKLLYLADISLYDYSSVLMIFIIK